ncbi:hypothetical protein QBC33DRAFT_595504 [Phialemonium atrogriseum]|uniref:Uncharacterized protein n=1 Tax=Phialemonium atrogriseum TaxID=1093897 RepID=A0AAJ0FIC8_9PEZI|nr:uncharacterized protein QBC33DRAFT_595504 [Phialemonium atrogriseum]KAK1764248.1 hypothetical protein QBC33DRAFT_595504 [Phialemonium atrogriseum]
MDGTDFANNLFSDLGPLLTLFGERVAIQYLSHSTTWIEGLIFACAPIGILTAVVSAIRVGGSRWLKAIVGRAREPDADVELELMSSTSSDVCELWNGAGIVRVVGSPSIIELIYRSPDEANLCNDGTDGDKLEESLASSNADIEVSRRFSASPPNIVLNVSGGIVRGWELMIAAAIGMVLQAGVLVYDGLITYRLNVTRGVKVNGDALPLTVVGTMGLMLGTFLCALVVENSTEEEVWEATCPKKQALRIVWLQRGKLVGDQDFGSFVIHDTHHQQRIRTSRKIANTKRLEIWTLLGSSLTIISFVLQFVG